MIPTDVALSAVMLANDAGLRGTEVVGYGYPGVPTSNDVFIVVPYYVSEPALRRDEPWAISSSRTAQKLAG